MNKIFTILIILISISAFSQKKVIDSSKNINEYNSVEELKNLIGYEVLAIPRMNSKNPLEFPGVYLQKNGNFVEIKNYDEYDSTFSNNKYVIESAQENGFFIDVIMSNNNQKIKWSKSPSKLAEKPFILVPFLEFAKSKLFRDSFIYAKSENQYDKAEKLYEFSESDIYKFISFSFQQSEGEYSRFQKGIVKMENLNGTIKELPIDEFNYAKFYNTDFYFKLKNHDEKITKEKQSLLIKKYGPKTAKRILDGEIWIGMTREMLIDSIGNPKKINSTETKYSYTSQYIYEDRFYGTRYIYIENGKVTAIQD